MCIRDRYEETENGYKAPFLYSSNGRPYLKQLAEQSGIWFWDARTPEKSSYALERWHSPEDLLQKLVVNESKAEEELKEEPYPEFANRYYQIEAVKAVEKGLEENKRRMLLAMATGTGKTRLALSLMYRLIKTKRVRRVLFLVDRRSLGIQASDAVSYTHLDVYKRQHPYIKIILCHYNITILQYCKIMNTRPHNIVILKIYAIIILKYHNIVI